MSKPFGGVPTPAPTLWQASFHRGGQSWATLENTPFRLYKHFEHEGGVASPLVVHWPAGIAAKNEFRTEPSHVVAMATVADVDSATDPKEFNGHAILPMERRSLNSPFAASPGNLRVTPSIGNPKATPPFATAIGSASAEAPGVTGNGKISPPRSPEKTKQLLAKWKAWANRASVLPAPPIRVTIFAMEEEPAQDYEND